MSWETPKTNWTADEYFNRDDALRINRNFKVLTEMARDVYAPYIDANGNSPALLYAYRTYNIGRTYSVCRMSAGTPSLYNDSDFPVGAYDFTNRISFNWVLQLAHLYKLTENQTYTIIRVPTDVSTSYTLTRYYEGYGIYNNPSATEEDFSTYPSYSGITRSYCYTYRSLNSGLDIYQVYFSADSTRTFANQPFFNNYELNRIESRMLTVYNRLISYGG